MPAVVKSGSRGLTSLGRRGATSPPVVTQACGPAFVGTRRKAAPEAIFRQRARGPTRCGLTRRAGLRPGTGKSEHGLSWIGYLLIRERPPPCLPFSRRCCGNRSVAALVGGGFASARGTFSIKSSTGGRSARAGVVVIETQLGLEGARAAGTGMVLTFSGEVLTNNHVIEGATSIKVVIPGTGRSYQATVVGYDVGEDTAVLQLRNGSGLATVAVGDSSRLTVGQLVHAVGNAGGSGSLTRTTHLGCNPGRTRGEGHVDMETPPIRSSWPKGISPAWSRR